MVHPVLLHTRLRAEAYKQTTRIVTMEMGIFADILYKILSMGQINKVFWDYVNRFSSKRQKQTKIQSQSQ